MSRFDKLGTHLIVDEGLLPVGQLGDGVLVLEGLQAGRAVEDVAVEADRAGLQSGGLGGGDLGSDLRNTRAKREKEQRKHPPITNEATQM